MIPPLPKISGDLILEVFTHSSIRPEPGDEPTVEEYSSERLAELGRKVIDMVVTSCLFRQRPLLNVRQIEVEREERLSERKIEEIDGLNSLRARLRRSQSASDVDTPGQTRLLFESYIGAVYVEKGITVVEEWIKAALFPAQTPSSPPSSPPSSYPAGFFSTPTPPPPPQPTAAPPPVPSEGGFQPSLAFVNQIAAQKGFQISYTASASGPPHNPLWEARCILNGNECGVGRGRTQKLAKEEAARHAFRSLGWAHF